MSSRISHRRFYLQIFCLSWIFQLCFMDLVSLKDSQFPGHVLLWLFGIFLINTLILLQFHAYNLVFISLLFLFKVTNRHSLGSKNNIRAHGENQQFYFLCLPPFASQSLEAKSNCLHFVFLGLNSKYLISTFIPLFLICWAPTW